MNFAISERAITGDDGTVIIDRTIECGVAPDGWVRFAGIATVNVQNPQGQLIGQPRKPFPIPAATIEEAFEKAPELGKAALKALMAEVNQQLNPIIVPSGFQNNGHPKQAFVPRITG